MKRIYKAGVITLFTLLPLGMSCTSDEDVYGIPGEDSGGEIRFATGADLTKAKDITATNLTTFDVYAYTSLTDSLNPYMDNVVVTKSSNNLWTYSPVKYWPANETLDFYAFSPADWVGDNNPLRPVPYDAYPMSGGMRDIVYAVCMDLKGETELPNPQVILNFRHALSKVTLKFSSTNTDIKVVVTNVSLVNVKTKGNFSFPPSSTSAVLSAETVGKWSDQNTPYMYPLLMSQSASERVTLDSTPTVFDAEGMGFGGTLYVMPQPLAWQNNGTGTEDAYIAVMCSIYDAKSDTKLWPNENTPKDEIVENSTFGDGIMKFPLLSTKFSEWQPGCHYIYNLVINTNDEMGGIQFGTPSVDSFIDVVANYE